MNTISTNQLFQVVTENWQTATILLLVSYALAIMITAVLPFLVYELTENSDVTTGSDGIPEYQANLLANGLAILSLWGLASIASNLLVILKSNDIAEYVGGEFLLQTLFRLSSVSVFIGLMNIIPIGQTFATEIFHYILPESIERKMVQLNDRWGDFLLYGGLIVILSIPSLRQIVFGGCVEIAIRLAFIDQIDILPINQIND